jgi:hypothetical protein
MQRSRRYTRVGSRIGQLLENLLIQHSGICFRPLTERNTCRMPLQRPLANTMPHNVRDTEKHRITALC